MLRVTFKSLLARKLRLLLTALAVVLGVSFVSGTLILGDTLNATFDKLFSTAYSGTDVGVRGEAAFKVSVADGGDATQSRPPVPVGVLQTVRDVNGVRQAEGDSSGFAQIVRPDGKVIETSGAPTLGGSWLGDTPLEPLPDHRGVRPECRRRGRRRLADRPGQRPLGRRPDQGPHPVRHPGRDHQRDRQFRRRRESRRRHRHAVRPHHGTGSARNEGNVLRDPRRR